MDKTLLVNGCSYTLPWDFSRWWRGWTVINQAVSCGNNRRSMRMTMDWILMNGNPGFVIIPLTYYNRKEYRIDNGWISISARGITGDADDRQQSIIQDMQSLETDLGRMDQLLTDLIMFTTFLESRNIPHLIFNWCNDQIDVFSLDLEQRAKYKYIESLKGVLTLDFAANEYLDMRRARLLHQSESNLPVRMRHYQPESYRMLEPYLDGYIGVDK